MKSRQDDAELMLSKSSTRRSMRGVATANSLVVVLFYSMTWFDVIRLRGRRSVSVHKSVVFIVEATKVGCETKASMPVAFDVRLAFSCMEWCLHIAYDLGAAFCGVWTKSTLEPMFP